MGSKDSSAKPGRVDGLVATVAHRVGTVGGQLLADRGGPPDVRLQAFDTRRGWGCRTTQDIGQHEVAARYRGCHRAVGGDLVDAGVREQSAAGAIRRQLHPAHLLALDARYAVVLRQTAVDVGEVRVDQTADAAVLVDKFLEEEFRSPPPSLCLGGRRIPDRARPIRRGLVHLGRAGTPGPRNPSRSAAIGRLRASGRLGRPKRPVQIVARGRRVRTVHRPACCATGIGQPRGQRVVIQRTCGRCLIEERRSTQDSPHRYADRFHERCAGGKRRFG